MTIDYWETQVWSSGYWLWTNPAGLLELDARDYKGNTVHWNAADSNPRDMTAQGWSRKILTAGYSRSAQPNIANPWGVSWRSCSVPRAEALGFLPRSATCGAWLAASKAEEYYYTKLILWAVFCNTIWCSIAIGYIEPPLDKIRAPLIALRGPYSLRGKDQ